MIRGYALSYDDEVQVPDVIQDRAMPQHLEIASEEAIQSVINEMYDK